MADQRTASQEANTLNTQESAEEKAQSLNHKEVNDSSSVSSDAPSEVVIKSFGIRRVELIMAQMTRPWHKVLFCFFIFFGMFIISVDNSAVAVFVGYATNSYKQHSLMSTIGVIRGVAAGASMPFYARAADNFGRLPLYMFALIFKLIGLVVQAHATDIQKYGAGTVFYALGNSGLAVLWQLSLSDATTLKYRVLAVACMSMPQIINTWAIGDINDEILTHHTWAWGIALWAYVSSLVCLLYAVMYLVLILKARRTDAWKQINQEEHASFIEGSPRAERYHLELSTSDSVIGKLKGYAKWYCLRGLDNLHAFFWKVDFVGCLLLAVSLGLLLVPLTLAGGMSTKWKKASIIVPLVMTIVALAVFIIWETKITKRPLLPWKVMKDRGIWAGFLVGLFTCFIYGMPNDYAYPVMLVGMNATITVATRTPALKGFTEAIAIPIFGLAISRIRRTKAIILFGVVLIFLSSGLFVHFRGSNDGIRDKYFRDGVAISMCFLGVANACLLRVAAASIQSCTNHEYMGVVTAIFSMSYTIGLAISNSVSGAIWTQQMYQTIARKMTELGVDPTLAMNAYAEPYTFIMTSPWGTPARRAVSMAYAEIQRKLSIVGVCLCVVLLVCVLLLRDHVLPESQNLGDADMKTSDPEQAKEAAIRNKSRVVFTDDKDYILIYLKKLWPFGKK
ncbi:hypothetical_protein [Candidozyma auris]|uniref:hypothetical_protein n=1 Tax=Candidozyma auris TaxID=498019 RepID=UPI000D2E9375|nr:hypothetical_protein [[Candida] auris]QEO19242.1 hypothetical_protein [[Candida] auris]GBL50778.1 hypothetical protein CAJCM15448_30520 [[Candida] auris]